MHVLYGQKTYLSQNRIYESPATLQRIALLRFLNLYFCAGQQQDYTYARCFWISTYPAELGSYAAYGLDNCMRPQCKQEGSRKAKVTEPDPSFSVQLFHYLFCSFFLDTVSQSQ